MRYLRGGAGELPVRSRPHLLKAAGIYEQLVSALDAGRGDAPFTFQLKRRKWTKAQRRAEAETLKRVAGLEKEAVAEIEKALSASSIRRRV